MRIEMMFPVIAVTDNSDEKKDPHIVGSDSHDVLELDEATGGIHYLNLHCCESTRRYPSREKTDGFSFVAEEWESGYNPVIKMVSFKELCEIYLMQLNTSIEEEKKLRAFIREVEAKQAAMIRDFEDSKDGKPCLTTL